ncbi:MAG: ECF transporter S component [Bacillota bacterium]|nr:ECF transporter S component [Bacillota bacterium]
MERKDTLYNSKTLSMVQVAIMAAIIYVATWLIQIPVATGGFKGLVHLGDSMVFVAAVLLGRNKAATASAVGMCLFDLLSPYAMWAPFTFVIKGLMAYIAATIAYRNGLQGKSVINNVVGFVLGGIWMILGYFGAGILLNHFGMHMPWNQSYIAALPNIPADIAQVVIGIIIATPLSLILKKANVIHK